MGRQIQVSISDEDIERLDRYCKTAGASRSKVIQLLLDLHLEELIINVSNIKFLDKDGNEVKD